MKNYISINGRQIELTDEQAQRIESDMNLPKLTLADIPVGKTFRIGSHEFIVLEQMGDTVAVIRKELLGGNTEFGTNNNNYDGSYVDERCREFAQDLAAIIGWETIILHEVNLTSDDGLRDYGVVERRASLLTADLYRRYVEILDNFKSESWWWLATPHSTKRHGNDSWVKCVSPSGRICIGDYGNFKGVRPFCILKSTIFVST